MSILNFDSGRYARRGHQDDDYWRDGVPEWFDEGQPIVVYPTSEKVGVLESRQGEPALLLKVEEAARLLGVGRTTLFELIGQGRIQTVRVGRRRLVVRAGLERFIKEICS